MDTFCLRILHAVVNFCNRFLPTMILDNGTIITCGIKWEDAKAEYLTACRSGQQDHT